MSKAIASCSTVRPPGAQGRLAFRISRTVANNACREESVSLVSPWSSCSGWVDTRVVVSTNSFQATSLPWSSTTIVSSLSCGSDSLTLVSPAERPRIWLATAPAAPASAPPVA
ncbi:hypothetical protein [Nonomuraea salmonea]|uniref:hypothetical protein n=1 Tax=Nonomuraea salmonea TaxID=46181 RepID=UPI003CD09D5D